MQAAESRSAAPRALVSRAEEIHVAERILVVDDSRELRTLLGMQLKKQGYSVETAVDGQDGLEKAISLKPQLIIMDIMMPRMDGFTAAKQIRQEKDLAHTPIILLSALGGEEDIIKGIECGADDYLIKPFKAPELSAKVKMLIRKSAGFTNRSEDDTIQTAPDDPAVRKFKETGQVISKDFAGFHIVEKVGQGGSGTVYRAVEPMHNMAVALKVVSPFVSRSPGFVDRFTRSSEISIKLIHPNIVRCYTMGEYQGVHFITQELIEGPELDKLIKQRKKLGELEGLKLMRQLIDALKYLESEGLIHRDIKPSNIFVVEKDGQQVAKLADFGLSRGAHDLNTTLEGHVLGTPHYLSPEQAKGEKNIDVRGDLYSLAATFYQALTGKTVFEADNLSSLVLAHINREPVSPLEANPDLMPETGEVLLRFLKKTPEERADNMEQALAMVDGLIAKLESQD